MHSGCMSERIRPAEFFGNLICFCEDDEAELIRVCIKISDPAFNSSSILCIFRYFLIFPMINWNHFRLVCKSVSYVFKVVVI